MKKLAILAIIYALTIQGCAKDQAVSKTTDTRACIANFFTEGDFLTGKSYKTYEEFQSISKASAIESLIASLASNGYQIVSSNKDLGVISASQALALSRSGATVPLNAVVKENASGGVRIDLVLRLFGGLMASSDSIQSDFCNILASINQSKDVTPTSKMITKNKPITVNGNKKKKK